jgi:uridine phosphorylase
VLLPGDPARALALAQHLLSKPLMFNHHRGLWGYTGQARDGEPLTIQSTGMGGPSAAIVMRELIALGARRAIRVGTCGALSAKLALGDLVVAREAIAADGTSRALGAGERVLPDALLNDHLQRACSQTEHGAHPDATIVSTDLFYDASGREQEWIAAGAVAVEMEAASLFALSASFGVAVACVLVVSDLLDGQRVHIDDDSLLASVQRMGEIASSAILAA